MPHMNVAVSATGQACSVLLSFQCCLCKRVQSLRIIFLKCTFKVGFSFLLSLPFLLGIELDDDGSLDGNSDLTIRGRLLSLVEKVTSLKKKQADKPAESASDTSCKQRERQRGPLLTLTHPFNDVALGSQGGN